MVEPRAADGLNLEIENFRNVGCEDFDLVRRDECRKIF